MTVPESHIPGRACIMKKTISKVTPIALIMTIMFSISALAATCGVKGCYKSTVYGGSYCKSHTCSKSGCKNLAVDGGYCSSHQKKTYGSNSSSSASGQTGSKTCSVSGCSKSTTGGSAYCYTHKCRHSGCKNYGSEDGYCSNHAKQSSSSGSTSSEGKKYGNSGSSSSGSSSQTKQCIVSGCHNSR